MVESRRRNPRVATTLLVEVEGVDPRATPRNADISARGVYFDTDQEFGEVGTVQWLRLTSADRACTIQVMAHVVRNVAAGERPRSPSAGVALEFMPESDDRTEELHDFVRYVLSYRREVKPPVDEIVVETVEIPSAAPTVRQLSAGRLSLYSKWAIAIGDTVRLEIVAPGVPQPILLRGRAVHVVDAGDAAFGQFRIEVEMEEEREGPLRRLSSATFQAVKPGPLQTLGAPAPAPPPAAAPPEDELEPFPEDDLSSTLEEMLSALINVPDAVPPARRAHLSGLLTRGRLPMLAALFDMERISGELTLNHGAERSRLFVQRGRIIDVEPLDPSTNVRTELARLFGWTDGSFEFVIREIDRPDRVEATVNALLLDLAHRADEASRASGASEDESRPDAIDSI